MRLLLFLIPFLLFAADPSRVSLNLGSGSNDGTGDGLRATFTKINTNVINLWSQAFTNGPASKLAATNGTAVSLTGSLTNVSIFGSTVIDTGDELQDTVDYSLALTPNGVTATSNDATPRPQSVATIASLVSDVDPALVPSYARVFALGYHASGDGGGGVFMRVSAGSMDTNMGTVFQSTANATYAWERVKSGTEIDIRWFGGVGDGATDSTAAISNALAYAYALPAGTVVFPEGTFRHSGIDMPRFTRLLGATAQGQKNDAEGATILKLLDGVSGVSSIRATNECSIENLQIDGNKSNVTGTSYGIHFDRIGIFIESTVESCSVVNTLSGGIRIEGNEVTVRNSSVLESDGHGIYVGACTDIYLTTILCGWSGGDGLRLEAGASTRLFQVDSYFSRGNGYTFKNPLYHVAYRLQADLSFGHGIEIITDSAAASIDIYDPLVYGSNSNDDGKGRTNSAASGTYSDLCFSGVGTPANVKINGGNIGLWFGSPLKTPLYNICWSNIIAPLGSGITLADVRLESGTGTRTSSGLSGASGWASGEWSGRLLNFYNGAANVNYARSPETFDVGDYLTVGGAAAARPVTTSKNGVQIKGDSGESFGLYSSGANFLITSDADSTPSMSYGGAANTITATATTFAVAGNSTVSGTLITGGTTSSGRSITTPKIGIQIKGDTGENFGLYGNGATFDIASDADATPKLSFAGAANTITATATTFAVTGAATVSSTLAVGGATPAGRDLTTAKTGVQIKGDTGENFGIYNSGSVFYIASDSDSTPNLALNGVAGTVSVTGDTSFSTNVVILGSIDIGNASDTTLARSAAGVVTIEGKTVQTSGMSSYWDVDAGAMAPWTTDGATATTETLTTNGAPVDTYVFSTSTVQSVSFKVAPNWDATTLTLTLNWRADSLGDAVWGVSALAYKAGEYPDFAFGSEVLVTNTSATVLKMNTATTPAITPSGTLSTNSTVLFRLRNVTTSASDTLTNAPSLWKALVNFTRP